MAAQTDVDLGSDGVGVGTAIDHFRVLRVLGQGGMGRVLLARDVRLGRLVAIKLLRPDKDAADRVLALLDEARLTAQVVHPNVVTIHQVGRFGHSPYLAFEYVDGPNLRQRMREGDLGEREVVRIGVAVASALAAAHAAGISHRDLKPENILIGKDGRLRVADFGIAAVRETIPAGPSSSRGGEIIGTPGYMAPEQWLGLPASTEIDLWALGVLLYELLAGHRPFEGPRMDARSVQARVLDVGLRPARLDVELNGLADLIDGLLDRDPSQRPTAAVARDRLEAMLAGPALAGRQAGPYRGLLAFEEHDAAWFFGRESEVDALVEQLRRATVVPLVGPSGAGKSSLVRAGLMPRLREQGNWTVLALRPGSRPLDALAARLVAQDTTGRHSLATTGGRDMARALADDLLINPKACNLRLHAIAEARASRVLLVVDQFEEVVTHATSAAERDAFLDAIAEAADVVDEQVRVIVTVRDDFLGQVATRPSMRRALRDVFVVRRLDAEALRQAIALPLVHAGGSFDDPTLPDAMVAEVEGESAALPLVQFACAALWEKRDRASNVLRRQDYVAMGGVVGALGRHAETVLSGMTPDAVDAARRLLLQLVGPEGARRVVERGQAIAAAGEEAEMAVERLTSARLMTSRRAHDGQGAHVVLELAHEALTRSWPQLQRWLEESSDERAALAEVEAAAALWQRRGRRQSELWGDGDVRDARRRLRDAVTALPAASAEFLQASAEAAARARKRRVVGWTSLGAVLVVVAAASLATAARMSEQEHEARSLAARIEAKNREIEAQARKVEVAAAEKALAAADMGVVRVSLRFFDWDDQALQARAAAAPPRVEIEVWQPDPDVPFDPAQQRDPSWVRVGPQRASGDTLTFELETRAGAAILRVKRPGCGAFDLPLRQFPGFAERTAREERQDEVPAWEFPAPSCQASVAGTIEIPAGPFYDGGPGEPPLRELPAEPERLVELPAYRIDRTETPNALWSVFERAAALTGVPSPNYPDDKAVPRATLPEHPVTGVDAYGAAAFCRWLGRRLPSAAEWVKAARGGVELRPGVANPHPRRAFPWGVRADRDQAGDRGAAAGVDLTEGLNLQGVGDAWEATAPVAEAGRDRSPYGVLMMATNVEEWTGSPMIVGRILGTRQIKGTGWSYPREVERLNVGLVNERIPRHVSLGHGWRCASSR